MNHPLRCQCGALQGIVSHTERVNRAVCYCRDCQAYAHFLGKPGDILDASGGTDVVATLPKYLSFTQGVDRLACMSLTSNGLLRWYASCCNTPIGNTTRNCKFPFVGLVHACLSGSSEDLNRSFGPVRMRVNTKGAKTPIESNAMGTLAAIVPFFISVARARLDGGYKVTPFFDPNHNAPVVPPTVLSQAERERVMNAV